MSADNFLYVCKRGDKWIVTDRSASVDNYPDEAYDGEHAIAEFSDAWDAHQEAARLDYTGLHYTEYGVSLSPAVGRALGFTKDES